MPPRRAVLAAAAVALLARAAGARASTRFAERPIHVVVPFPAGGGADNLARTILPRAMRALDATLVIENRPGAGGNVGAEFVARAPPDGFTLLYGTNGTHAINPALYANLRFDPVASFAPVSRMTRIGALLVVRPDFPARTVAELVRHARANPGRVSFASAGNGTTSHLAGEMFRAAAGLELLHVPYRGGALAITDVAGGHVDMMIEVMPNALPFARAGKVRAIAVTTARRFPRAPEYPTFSESGLPGFEVSAWDGVFAPAGTPADVVDRLNAAIRTALDDPQVREQLLAHGAVPAPDSPAEFARHIAAEAAKWAAAVRRSGARVD